MIRGSPTLFEHQSVAFGEKPENADRNSFICPCSYKQLATLVSNCLFFRGSFRLFDRTNCTS